MRPLLVVATLTALVGALLLTPVASAQTGLVETTTTVIIIDEGDPVPPLRPTTLSVRIAYQWGQGGGSAENTSIALSVVDHPAWLTSIEVVPPVVEASVTGPNRLGQASTRTQVNATLNFTVSPDAPAYRDGNITILAQSAENGNLQASEGRGTVTIRPEWVGVINVTGGPTIVRGGAFQDVPFNVANNGNGAATVAFRVLTKPEPSQIQVPETLTIAAGASEDVVFRLKLPWTTGVDAELRIEAEAVSTDNPFVDPILAQGSAEVDGQSAVPGPGLGALVAALGAVAMARRRRR